MCSLESEGEFHASGAASPFARGLSTYHQSLQNVSMTSLVLCVSPRSFVQHPLFGSALAPCLCSLMPFSAADALCNLSTSDACLCVSYRHLSSGAPFESSCATLLFPYFACMPHHLLHDLQPLTSDKAYCCTIYTFVSPLLPSHMPNHLHSKWEGPISPGILNAAHDSLSPLWNNPPVGVNHTLQWADCKGE